MVLRQALTTLRAGNVITEKQHDTLLGLISGKTLSLYWEIRALFYVGVIAIVMGAGAVIQRDFTALGPAAVILVISLVVIGCFIYCGVRAKPFSVEQQPAPSPAFDYLLYAGCALTALDLGAIETQFHVLAERADLYLLGTSLFFLVLAYRFDNRLVLTLGLTSLAAWCGLKFQSLRFASTALYPIALAYGVTVAGAGVALTRLGIKKHFLDVYLNIAAHVLFITLLAGMFVGPAQPLYSLGLISCCAVSLWHGTRTRRFLYVLYAIVYGYIGLSGKIIPHFHDIAATLLYLIASSVVVVTAITMISRRFKEHE